MSMDSFCDGDIVQAQPIAVDVEPKGQKQYQADALRILEGLPTRGSACKRLQIRCGCTPCLHPEIMAIRERDITDFRSTPDFDLIYFTFAMGQQPGPEMVERFQYCRMLLKPGGLLVLLLPDNKRLADRKRPRQHFFPAFMSTISISGRISFPVALLQSSGLVKVHRKDIARYGVIVTGSRPVSYNRR